MRLDIEESHMETAEITVAAEKSVHDAMRELAQEIWDKHGIRVDSVYFSWADLSSPVMARMMATGVRADTSTRFGRFEPVKIK